MIIVHAGPIAQLTGRLQCAPLAKCLLVELIRKASFLGQALEILTRREICLSFLGLSSRQL
jgi:hypothetical protein